MGGRASRGFSLTKEVPLSLNDMLPAAGAPEQLAKQLVAWTIFK